MAYLGFYFNLLCHWYSRAYLRGGGGFKPSPEMSDFYLKSEGKEVERNKNERNRSGV